MDLGIRLTNHTLVGYWKNDGAHVHGDISSGDFPAFGIRALAIFDADTPAPLRPPGNQWNFLGVGPGEPVYILPSSGNLPNIPYLGFSTEDPSLSLIDPEPETYRFTLTAMTGPSGSVFTIYLSSANVPINTTNGFPAGHIDVEPGDHLHYNLSFSRLGTYDLTFRLDALDGSEVLLTGNTTFRFHITDGSGFPDYHAWRITLLTPDDLADPARSDPLAQPYPDLPSNLQRYAFGDTATILWTNLSPTPDHILPGLVVHERVGTADLTLDILSTTNLLQPASHPASLTLEADHPIFHNPGLHRRIYRLDDPPQPFRALHQRAILTP